MKPNRSIRVDIRSAVGALVILLAACGGEAVRPEAGMAAEPVPAATGQGTAALATPADTRIATAPEAAPAADPASCAAPADCALHEGCCPACRELGAAGLRVGTRAQIAAWVEAERGLKCDCNDCEKFGPDPGLVADCQGGRCAILDLRASEYVICAKDADCVLASPICCSAAHEPTAFSAAGLAAFRARWCAEAGCNVDVPAAAGGLAARCRAGRCAAVGEWQRQGR